MKLDGKNRNLSKLRDCYNRTGSALFGGIGRVNFENLGICNLRKGDQILMIFDI